jgi:hypothetical protein
MGKKEKKPGTATGEVTKTVRRKTERFRDSKVK